MTRTPVCLRQSSFSTEIPPAQSRVNQASWLLYDSISNFKGHANSLGILLTCGFGINGFGVWPHFEQGCKVQHHEFLSDIWFLPFCACYWVWPPCSALFSSDFSVLMTPPSFIAIWLLPEPPLIYQIVQLQSLVVHTVDFITNIHPSHFPSYRTWEVSKYGSKRFLKSCFLALMSVSYLRAETVYHSFLMLTTQSMTSC